VLPFDNLSGDPDQEYFADGIAEDRIARLSSWRWFPVIAPAVESLKPPMSGDRSGLREGAPFCHESLGVALEERDER
jgi:TolB-like protein